MKVLGLLDPFFDLSLKRLQGFIECLDALLGNSNLLFDLLDIEVFCG
jgi:hypothetical protein